MEWRIRESSHGGFVAERGIAHEGGVLAPTGIGCTMPAFIRHYESFDLLELALNELELAVLCRSRKGE